MRALRHATYVAIFAGLLLGCEGISVEIVLPTQADGTVGAPGVVGWELRVDPIAEDLPACPRPAEHRFDGPAIWVPADTTSSGLEGLGLSPGRYMASAIGRSADCRALFFGRTCFGPDAPPRVVSLTTCEVAGEGCVDFGWTDPDRAALGCATGVCAVGRCD